MILRHEPLHILLQRITVNAAVCHGQPCIRGMRYPVAFLLELLSAGMSHKEILEDYEDLEPEDLTAALMFAAQLSNVGSIERIAF